MQPFIIDTETALVQHVKKDILGNQNHTADTNKEKK